MKICVKRLVTLVVLLALPALVTGQEATSELTLDNEVNHLFQKDPNPGDEDSGCSICVYRIDVNTLSCDPVTDGQGFTKCKITVNETESTCESSGSSCTVTQVNP